MNIQKLVLSLCIGFLIVGSQAQGSALKTGLEITKHSSKIIDRGVVVKNTTKCSCKLINDGVVVKTKEEHIAFFESHPGIVQFSADYGIANSAAGHAALLHVRPDLAQTICAPRHNLLSRILELEITHPSGKKIKLPDDIADHIASFNTGITILPESAKQEMIKEVFSESNKYKESLL